METTLLATKFFIPRVTPGLVIRPRLVQRLQGVLNNRLTLVSAPAGFGKTTILSQWIQESHIPTAWLSLEDAENDPVRFWDYFIAALQTIVPNIGKSALPLLHSSQTVLIESTLTVLINDITTIQGDYVLVLDDYYFIHSEAVHQGLTYFLEHMPPGVHLVIATRVDPPLSLAHFRGKGAMLEMVADDLRFTTDETAGLLMKIMGQELATKDLEAINARAEGWVVGLKMAALSLGKQRILKESIAAFTGSQRYIMDYLIEEVLKHQSKDVRDFLLQTSVLERLNGPLCDAITQSTGSYDRLLSMEKANLFLIPLDDSREWYRYHHLFAELLRHQLDLESGKDMAYELHRRASHWYETNGLLEEAIDHALAARDWERAIEIIGHPAVMSRRTGSLTMFNWLRNIPVEILRSHGERYINYMWALLSTGQYTAAEECLKYLDTVAENNNHLHGRIAVARATIAGRTGDLIQAEQYARKALSLLNPDSDDERAIASLALGSVLVVQGHNLEAEPLLKQSVELCKRAVPSLTIEPLAGLGNIAMGYGRLHEAVKLYQEVIELAGDDPHPGAGNALLWLGFVYYQWNDLEASARYLEKAIEIFQLSVRGVLLESAYLFLARTRAAAGDIQGAMKSLEDADRLISQGGTDPGSRAINAAYHAAVALMVGDKESAAKWVDSLAEPDIFVLLSASLSALRLFWARTDGNTVVKKAQVLREQLAQQGSPTGVVCVQIVQALESLRPDNPDDCLAEALKMCRSTNIIRIITDIGMEVTPLLKQAISHNIEPEFARKLLTIIEAEDRQRKIRKGELPPSSAPASILSEREMEVLLLVAQGLSNQQIADKLTITLSTAKTHVYHLFDKLDATDRLKAVTRARELRIL